MNKPFHKKIKRLRRLDGLSIEEAHMNEARGTLAYLEEAKPLPWEGTPLILPRPNRDFGTQALQMRMQIASLQAELRNLDAQSYAGVGNDKQKLEAAIDDLRAAAERRDDQNMLFTDMPRTLLKNAIRRLHPDVSLNTYRYESKSDLILKLTEEFGNTIDEIEAAAHMTSPPQPAQTRSQAGSSGVNAQVIFKAPP